MFVFFKQKTAYEMRISDWSSDVCSSDLGELPVGRARGIGPEQRIHSHVMIGGCEGPAEQVKQTCFVIDAQRSAAPGLARGILGDGHVAGPRARCKRNGIAGPAAIAERRIFGEVSGYI